MARFLLLFGLILSCRMAAAEGKINKVLPHLLDKHGRIALSPSLFERDAYQAYLRTHPTNITGLRFDVHWKAPRAGTNAVVVRLELRTTHRAGQAPLILETNAVPARWGSRWTQLAIDGDSFRREGDVVAWRAVIKDGDREVASTQSFLW